MDLKATNALEVQGLTARLPVGLGWRRKTILEDMQLSLPRGQVLGLLGPNGSGKTTLLRHLAGLLRASRGTVRLFGQPATDPAVLARVTYLPEDSPFPEELNGPQVLALLTNLRGKRGPAVRAAQDLALERAGLANVRKLPLGRYSRGMLRRFGLAQAFLLEPELVLLDEPTAGLDAPGLLLLDAWIREHRARGGSLVLSSHSLSDLVDHTDRLAILWQGRVAVQGPTRSLLTDPESKRTQWRGPVDVEAVRAFLADQGATDIATDSVSRSVFDLYREIQAREPLGH